MKIRKIASRLLFAVLSVAIATSLSGQTSASNDDKTIWGKNIIYTPQPPDLSLPATSNLGEQPKDMLIQITYLDSEVLPGAYYAESSWLYKAYPDKVWVKSHTHDSDEVFGLYGSNPANPGELNGEIELWIGGEKHLITKSCLIFIPKGVIHCPLILRRIDKPVFFFTTMPSPKYNEKNVP
jgi:hypothetical protein